VIKDISLIFDVKAFQWERTQMKEILENSGVEVIKNGSVTVQEKGTKMLVEGKSFFEVALNRRREYSGRCSIK
jgi:hypothetical protein